VSSADQRPDLDRQVARVATWAAQEGLAVGRIVTEIGSAPKGRHRRGPHEACLVGPRRRSWPGCGIRPWPPSWSSPGIGSPGRGRVRGGGAGGPWPPAAGAPPRVPHRSKPPMGRSEVDDDLQPHAGAPHRNGSDGRPRVGNPV